MLTSSKYVFIHLEKCGGTFIRYILEKYFEGKNVNSFKLPETYSLDLYNKYNITYGNLSNMAKDPHGNIIPNDSKDKIIIGSIRNPFDYYVSLYTYCLSMKSIKNVTFKTWLKTARPFSECFDSKYGKFTNIKIIKLEHVCDDLINIMGQMYNINKDICDQIHSEKKINTTERSCYRDYYDNDCKDIVYKNDKNILHDFNYTF
jgi:hypothetical protein